MITELHKGDMFAKIAIHVHAISSLELPIHPPLPLDNVVHFCIIL